MPDGSAPDIAHLLERLNGGDGTALGDLTVAVYPELHQIATARLRRERPGHVLQAHALVHEAYLRLSVHQHHNWRSREHFLGAAAQIMRRVLIDHSRAMDAAKRGGRQVDSMLRVRPAVESAAATIFALDEALRDLALHAPRQARVVKLRYLRGFTVSHIAHALGLTARTVDRDSAAARIWLRRRLSA